MTLASYPVITARLQMTVDALAKPNRLPVSTGEPMPELRGQGFVLMFGLPMVVFVALWSFFNRRLSA